MVTSILHYSFHFIYPLWPAYLANKEKWLRPYLIMLATMAVDLDHLWATPIYDPHRNSINFHPLHMWYCFPVYIALLFFKNNLRWLGMGLCLHICTDWLDGIL
jgi:hypothetical protein